MMLVVGATAFFGRQAVETLAARGVPVRALTRNPSSAALPAGVQTVQADLTKPETLPAAVEGVSAVLLVLPLGLDPAPLLDLVPGRRIVVLSSSTKTAYHQRLEEAVAAATPQWTALRILFPAINSFAFAQQLPHGDVLRVPYPTATTTAVHERDVAEAAAAVLTGEGHAGRVYELTGPESLTQEDQAGVLAEALERPLRVEAADPDAVLRQLSAFMDADFAAGLLAAMERTTTGPAAVTPAVEELTGHPARPYAEWVRDHLEAFR
ncbi:NAD(P)H-binding protein [Dactylosporangium sp. CS-033363]|uniref:SDR family oxidoreductase n=1 Tax=Dactylosporangium sp. CS-033363 TaxID=3239935 RepID=UPI003D8A89AC